MREWDIPYDELQIGDEIGVGRFGKVYRGYWHGDVAIKVLNMEYVNDEKTLEQFKMEVRNLAYQTRTLSNVNILGIDFSKN